MILRGCAIAVILAACGDNLRDPFVGLVRVTGDSPFATSCSGPGQRGTSHRGLEVEPWLAVDPRDPRHLIGVWQQDRWSNGGAAGTSGAVSFDGGATWQRSGPRFSRCTGGDFERATDPWVTFAPDGTAYQIALAFDATSPRHAIVASASTDGGLSWSDPATLRADNDADVFNDKEMITADPTDPRYVYAVWDRLTGLSRPRDPIGTGPAWFARAVDGVWEPARPIHDPGIDAQTIGNIVQVLPDGTLLDIYVLLRSASSDRPVATIEVIRSRDRGATWSAPIEIAGFVANAIRDPANGRPIRSGNNLAAVATHPVSGELYVVWEDSRFGDGSVPGIALARSTDGGETWSPPVRVNGDAAVAAFTPAVAVTPGGTVGVTYFDLREPAPSELRATAWLATSPDGLTWSDERLTEPFDLRRASIGEVYFLGDYHGLAVSGDQLVPFFAAASAPGDIFVRPAF